MEDQDKLTVKDALLMSANQALDRYNDQMSVTQRGYALERYSYLMAECSVQLKFEALVRLGLCADFSNENYFIDDIYYKKDHRCHYSSDTIKDIDTTITVDNKTTSVYEMGPVFNGGYDPVTYLELHAHLFGIERTGATQYTAPHDRNLSKLYTMFHAHQLSLRIQAYLRPEEIAYMQKEIKATIDAHPASPIPEEWAHCGLYHILVKGWHR